MFVPSPDTSSASRGSNMSCLLLLLQAYLIYSSSVAAGAQSGIEECKYQFAWDRWNCPERALQLNTHSSLRSGRSSSPRHQQRQLALK